VSSHRSHSTAGTAIVLIIATGVLWGGCDVEDEIGDQALAIVGGTETNTTDAVVALELDGSPYCSGALIAPRVVLTAAHCILAEREADIEVFFGAETPVVAVEEALVHPDWNGETDDLALLVLDQPAPAAIAPLDLVGPAEGASIFTTGAMVLVTGFGRDESGRPGTKREAITQIEAVGDTVVELVPLPGITCDGDSGGPLLVPTASGGRQLIGIHTRSNCTDTAFDERIDVQREFIDLVVASIEDEACDHCIDVIGGCNSTQNGSSISIALLLALSVVGRGKRQVIPH